MTALEFHPIANVFPLLADAELRELADDIKTHGLREPITIHEGKILDGRNRYKACQLAGVTPRETTFSGNSPTAFVISLNLKRRHLTPSQRAAFAVEFLPWLEKEAKERQRKHAGTAPGKKSLGKIFSQVREPKSSEKAAEQLNTNSLYVSDAKAIKEKSPELFKAIVSGEKTISEVKREIKKAEIVKKVATLPSDKFRVLYADPPWSYGNSGVINDEQDNYGKVARHYPSMTIAELCAMDVKSIADDNAVMFLWVTSPLLDECWPVIRAWGFQYKTSFVWDKVKHNFGHYNSVRHEFLLICTRGSCTPDVNKLFDSVVSEEKSDRHSEKPEVFREMIDTLYPHGKRIELFARKKSKGWEVYGNEA